MVIERFKNKVTAQKSLQWNATLAHARCQRNSRQFITFEILSVFNCLIFFSDNTITSCGAYNKIYRCRIVMINSGLSSPDYRLLAVKKYNDNLNN
jgi:hypothetical protein